MRLDTWITGQGFTLVPESASRENSPQLPRTRQGWSNLLRELGIRPSKGMGQNFLFDQAIIDRMVAASGSHQDETIVEIGPGLGILTHALLEEGANVVAIELDDQLAAHLQSVFGGQAKFRLLHADALQVNLDDVVSPGASYRIVANLPYSIGTVVARRFLEAPHPPTSMTLMLQREVAERMAAQPPAMSLLSVATQFYAACEVEFTVPNDVFLPPPEVESAVITLTSHTPPLPAERRARFFAIVTAGFRQKRKQLANALGDELKMEKHDVARWLTESGVDASRRAQTLSVAEWVAISDHDPRRGQT